MTLKTGKSNIVRRAGVTGKVGGGHKVLVKRDRRKEGGQGCSIKDEGS